jgi:hypothetical protein
MSRAKTGIFDARKPDDCSLASGVATGARRRGIRSPHERSRRPESRDRHGRAGSSAARTARIGGTIASLSVKEGDNAAAGVEIAVVADPKLVLEMQGLPVTPNLAARGGLRLRRAARARRSPRLVRS